MRTLAAERTGPRALAIFYVVLAGTTILIRGTVPAQSPFNFLPPSAATIDGNASFSFPWTPRADRASASSGATAHRSSERRTRSSSRTSRSGANRRTSA